MPRTWLETVDAIKRYRIPTLSIAVLAGISEATVRNALKGRNSPMPLTRSAIDEAVTFLLPASVSGSDSHKRLAPLMAERFVQFWTRLFPPAEPYDEAADDARTLEIERHLKALRAIRRQAVRP
jgi:hypothetical protein